MTHYGFLSTYPPTRCGLATFTDALAAAIVRPRDDSASIVRVLEEPEVGVPATLTPRSRVRADLIAGDQASMSTSVATLNACDVAIVQHEYGIYGGPDGDEVLAVLAGLHTPAIVVLHTVLTHPTPRQRDVLIEVCARASAVVVMTRNAGEILSAVYSVDPARVSVIPHGVENLAVPEPERADRKRIVTWGLISPGKGIEWGIRAMPHLADITPTVEYVVAGQTHPKVLAHEGERYRTMLSDLAHELGVEHRVRLDNRYRNIDQLAALVSTADVVLLPYDARDQATSGVLAEAVAAGVPVVSTGFPHARELLADGAGIIADHEDPSSMAHALRVILTDVAAAHRMRDAARSGGHEMSWPAVAEQYRLVASLILAQRAA